MKKHILISSGSFRVGGIERIMVEYLNKIDSEKYKITLFILSDFGKLDVFKKNVPENITIMYLKPEKLVTKTAYLKHNKKNGLNKLLYNIYMSVERKVLKKNLKKNLKKIGKVDILIDFDSGLTKLHKVTKGIKKIVWIHASLPNLLKKEKKIKKYGKRLDNYDKIVTICKEMKEETEKLYPFLRKKIEYIYNPFDFQRIMKEAESSSELTKNEIKLLDDSYIVAVSRIDKTQKDFPTLIKAYKLLKEKGIKQKLYIVGDGDFKEELGRMIKKENLENEIKLLGQKKNPYIWMKNSDLFVHSSHYEGLPTVLIEAMILGKVVVSSACPTGPKEILENGESGLLFEVGKENEFSEKMFLALKDEDKRKSLEKKLKLSVQKFNSEKSLERLDRLIWELGE